MATLKIGGNLPTVEQKSAIIERLGLGGVVTLTPTGLKKDGADLTPTDEATFRAEIDVEELLEDAVLSAAASASSAELAKDAALVGAGLPYVDEPTGRAAVADGVVFKVQGTGDVAVYEYRRTNAGASTLIASYPSAVSVDKKLKGLLGKNLFNPEDQNVAIGYFPNNLSGVLQANATYNTSGFIPVVAGLSYSFSQKHYVCWYNASKVFISGTNDSNTSKTIVAPANAAFVRASAHITTGWPLFQIEEGLERTSYVPYGYILDKTRIGDRTIPGKKIENQSITLEETNFLKVGKNKFNKLSATIGYFLGNDGSAPVANATWDYSDFIPVTPGQQFKSNSNMRFTTFYSESQIIKTGGSNADITTIVVPAGVYFVRVTIYHTNLDTFQLEEGTAVTPYEKYGYVIQGPNNEELIPRLVDEAIIEDQAVSPKKTNFLQLGKNLFDKSVAVSGFLGPSGGVITASGTYHVSDFIAVEEGLPYYGAGSYSMRFTTYYNAVKQVVAGGSSNTISSFTPPAGVAFVRITINSSDLNTFQFEQSAVPTEFKPYGYVFKIASGEAIYFDDTIESPSWAGMSMGVLGDSIAAGATWQPKVATALGMTWVNYGQGGSKISGNIGDTAAMCQDTRINAMSTTHGLIAVLGGTNDWAQNVPLGAVDSTDPLNFNGALNTMIQKLCTRFADKRIVLLTTPYGELPSRVSDGTNNWPNAWTNGIGLTTRDYAEAIRGACKRWGIPFSDIAQDCGWNTINIRTYIADDGGLLHPNSVGGGRMSQVFLGTLKAIAPV